MADPSAAAAPRSMPVVGTSLAIRVNVALTPSVDWGIQLPVGKTQILL
jgi:hypothetical protein